jgi:hypothetical protein
MQKMAGEEAQMVEHLLSKCKAPSSNPNTAFLYKKESKY